MKKTTKHRCKSKITYNSNKAASNALNFLNSHIYNRNNISDTIRPYLCNVCNKWHLGHKYKKGSNDSINKVFAILNEEKMLS